MKYYIVVLLLCASSSFCAKDISCNERARHGRYGLAKAALATVGFVGLHYMIGELWEVSEPWRTDSLQVRIRYTKDSLKKSFLTAIALAALGYTTYKVSSESITSLRIYLDDDKDETSEADEEAPLQAT